MSRHNVHLIEGLRAIGTLPHAICNAVLHAVIAEEMAAGLQNRILEVLATYSAKCKSLDTLANIINCAIGTYSKHFFLA